MQARRLLERCARCRTRCGAARCRSCPVAPVLPVLPVVRRTVRWPPTSAKVG